MENAVEEAGKSRARLLCESMYDHINSEFFSGELPPIRFKFISRWADNRRAIKLFFFHDSNFYYDYDVGRPVIYVLTDGTKNKPYGYEFDVNGLFHSMAHYYCYLENGKKAHKAGEKIHDEFFKTAIEKHGGRAAQGKEGGYSITKIWDTGAIRRIKTAAQRNLQNWQ